MLLIARMTLFTPEKNLALRSYTSVTHTRRTAHAVCDKN